MGCGELLVKYILFFSNLFFALAGLALLGVGIAVQLRISEVVDIVDNASFQVAPITSIVLGSIVFLIAFFGCCGAIKESHCLLVTYAIFMLLLMILKVALAVVIFVNLSALTHSIPGWLNNAFSNNREAFYALQTTFKCCGANGATDYSLISVSLPPSCCEPESSVCTTVNAYPGCNSKVEEFFYTYGMVLGFGAIVVGAIELVAVVFGLCLANHVKNKDRRGRY